MEYKASYDNLVKIITISIVILATFFTIKSLNFLLKTDNLDISAVIINISIIIFFILLILFTWLYSPVSYIVDNENLIIKRHVGNYFIKLKEIKRVEKLTNNEVKGTIRYFGVGGLFGYFGKYYIPSYGKVKFYATQNRNRILIETTNGEKFLITPDDIDLFKVLWNKISNNY